MQRALALFVLVPGLAFAAPPTTDFDLDQFSEADRFFDAEFPVIDGFPGYQDEVYTPMIVNGTTADEGDYPETVYLAMSSAAGGGNCTGSLINSEFVLTAAHCIESDVTGVTVSFGNSTSSFTSTVTGDWWVIHEDYAGDEGNGFDPDNDIGLVHLASPVTDVFPMSLNADEITDDWVDEELEVTHIGFGITEDDGSDSGTKRVADVPLYDYDRKFIYTYDEVTGKAICQGDSGGPGVRKIGDAYVQIGIHSYVSGGCGFAAAGSVRVDSYLDWIEDQGADFSTAPASPPSFRCSRELDPGNSETVAFGVVPFTINCVVDYSNEEEVTSATWNWGDGTDATVSVDASHEYTYAGNFTLRTCVDGERSGAAWQHCVSRIGYVRSCDVPDVSFSYEAEGLEVQFLNDTDLSVYGCISDIQWEIYEGDAVSGEPMETYISWEPLVTFENPGTYTVVVNVGGPAGTAAQQLTIDVKRAVGSCSSMGAAGGVGFFPLLLGIAAVRRRRE